MPRSGGGRSGGGRPASRPASRPSGPPANSRGSHTMAAPAPHQQQQHAPANRAAAPGQQQGQAPGLFGQMASTAAGVAVGSSIGHGLSNMFFGGSSAETSPEQVQPAASDSYSMQSSGMNCEVQSKDFLRCLDATGNNMESCSFYLDQLKACQAAARPY